MNLDAILADLMLIGGFAVGCVICLLLWTLLFHLTIDRWRA